MFTSPPSVAAKVVPDLSRKWRRRVYNIIVGVHSVYVRECTANLLVQHSRFYSREKSDASFPLKVTAATAANVPDPAHSAHRTARCKPLSRAAQHTRRPTQARPLAIRPALLHSCCRLSSRSAPARWTPLGRCRRRASARKKLPKRRLLSMAKAYSTRNGSRHMI